MASFVISFLASLLLTRWLVRAAGRGVAFALDHDLAGPQKFHAHPVPRVGGVGIAGGLAAAALLLFALRSPAAHTGGMLLLCALPALGAGFAEDVTRRVSPRRRLLATAVSAALAFWLLGAQITRLDIPGLDAVVAVRAGALLVTLLAVAGIANSVNIIDGFNGLASMCVVIMLAALSGVAFHVGDTVVGTLGLAGIGAVLGFFCWNFPAGRVFMGDGGAYLLGYYVAELAILLLVRNRAVSPLFPLLVCIYPVFETVFSIYRRRFLRALPFSSPDGIHLHSLIYRRVLRWAFGGCSGRALVRRNSMTSPFLWLLCLGSAVPAVLFWDNSSLISVSIGIFAVVYVILYWRIVRFKSPRWMHMLAGHPPLLRESDNRGT